MARLTPIRLALLQDDRSQKWLADELGLSEPAVSRIVNGLLPEDDVIQKVCRALGRPASVLFPHVDHGSDQKPVPSTPSSEREAA